MGQSENTKVERDEIEASRGPSPRAADWLWRPRLAKSFWTLAAVYWIGLYGLLLMPIGQQNYYLANAMILLIFVFNPITVLAVLGYGFLKAKIACGDWIAGSNTSIEQLHRSRLEQEAADFNPIDARSGLRHLRHLGLID